MAHRSSRSGLSLLLLGALLAAACTGGEDTGDARATDQVADTGSAPAGSAGPPTEASPTAPGQALAEILDRAYERYATADGLRVGLARDRVRELLGTPDRSEVGEWRYELGSEDEPAPTLLRVAYGAEGVAALEWSFYVD